VTERAQSALGSEGFTRAFELGTILPLSDAIVVARSRTPKA
jgi:hypothetical protein